MRQPPHFDPIPAKISHDQHKEAIRLSQVPQLQTAILEFLQKNKIQGMLNEARILIGNLREKIHKDAVQILLNHGFDEAELTRPENIVNLYQDNVCRDILNRERELLHSFYNDLKTEIYEWRKSTEHQIQLLTVLDHMKTNFQTILDRELEILLNSTNGNTLWDQEFDDVKGETFSGVFTDGLIIQLERAIRVACEGMGTHLSEYYGYQFAQKLANETLQIQLTRRLYGQEYVHQRKNVIERFEEIRAQMIQDLKYLCQWSLMYEFIQHPLLGHNLSKESDLSVWKLIGELSSSEMIDEYIQDHIHTNRNFFDKSQETEAASQRKSFLAKLNSMLNPENSSRAQSFLSKELLLRFQTCLSMILPTIEDLFFFKIGSFRSEFAHLVDGVFQDHLAHLHDPNANIKTILLQQHMEIFGEIEQASLILQSLNGLEAEREVLV